MPPPPSPSSCRHHHNRRSVRHPRPRVAATTVDARSIGWAHTGLSGEHASKERKVSKEVGNNDQGK
ncbi:hypothetical protein Syun_027856 [Stephania yunnanensis]|uniref:Uncharacterized protein n=1 Tax=Stephania yunnanensis TaxID=152371 RepID=A0AAP0EIS1_9MAGN